MLRIIKLTYMRCLLTFQVELANAVAELEESNHKLAVLKAQGDTTHGTPIFFPTLGNKNMPGDNLRDKQKELQDLEACHKEFTVSIECLVFLTSAVLHTFVVNLTLLLVLLFGSGSDLTTSSGN
jgi:hypothetical protein